MSRLQLLLRFGRPEGTLEVLVASTVPRPLRELERRRVPTLDPLTPSPAPSGTAALVVTALDADLVPRAVHSFPARAFSFDGDVGEHGDVAGGVRTIRDDVRDLQVDVPDETRWLLFSEHAVAGDGGIMPWHRARPHVPLETLPTGLRPVVTRLLAAYWTLPDAPPSGPTPSAPGIVIQRLPWRAPLNVFYKHGKPGLGQKMLLHGDGQVAHRFNVVVLGDGFGEATQGELTQHAHAAKKALLEQIVDAVTPALRASVNIVFVPAIGATSGISSCAIRYPSSHFGVVQCTNPGHSHDPWMIRYWDRVDEARDRAFTHASDVDLTVMLLNIDDQDVGGFAARETKTCFIPFPAGDTLFDSRLAHESAHLIGGLCDEAVYCYVADCDHPTWPNVATHDQVRDGQLPWQGLLEDPDELQADHKHARAVQEYGDTLQDPEAGMLGAFAGCAFIAGPCQRDPQPQRCRLTAATAGTYYRPMLECRMLSLGTGSFCDACLDQIDKNIRATLV